MIFCLLSRTLLLESNRTQIMSCQKYWIANFYPVDLFIYFGFFYVTFNTVQVISRRVVGRAEETSTYSSSGFCTVNCRPTASTPDQLSYSLKPIYSLSDQFIIVVVHTCLYRCQVDWSACICSIIFTMIVSPYSL